MISRFFLWAVLIVAILGGCASFENKERAKVPHHHASTPTYYFPDDPPLLPRKKSGEIWAERNNPLPPLPEKVGAEGPSASRAEGPDASKNPVLGTVAPDRIVDLVQAYKGKILLLNCWGIDCGPCVEELPHLAKVQETYGKRGLSVVAVNTDIESRWPEVREFAAKNRFAFDIYAREPGPDTRFRQAVDHHYSADPFTVVYNREGKKVATIADALSREEWEAVARAVLENKPFPITDPDIVRLY